MLSRSSFTRRWYSSMEICPSHWKAVWGLGTKKEVDTVIRTPRRGSGVVSRQAWYTFSARSAMPSTSSSVSVGRPSMKYSFTDDQPPEKAVRQDWRMSSSVTFLLMASRRRWVPASGAKVRPDLLAVLKAVHQVHGEVVRPQGGQGQAHLLRLAPLQQAVAQLLSRWPVVAGGQGRQGHLLVARVLAGLDAVLHQQLRAHGTGPAGRRTPPDRTGSPGCSPGTPPGSPCPG